MILIKLFGAILFKFEEHLTIEAVFVQPFLCDLVTVIYMTKKILNLIHKNEMCSQIIS